MQWLRLGVEKGHIGGVDRVEKVLGRRDKLTCAPIDLDDQKEKFQVEWEVLDIVGETNHANDQLYERMYQ